MPPIPAEEDDFIDTDLGETSGLAESVGEVSASLDASPATAAPGYCADSSAKLVNSFQIELKRLRKERRELDIRSRYVQGKVELLESSLAAMDPARARGY
jgi:hypothetical protein